MGEEGKEPGQIPGDRLAPGVKNGLLKPEKVLQEGWYHSADYGRLDGEGFLFIEGRRARFSKIGGEMVPHGFSSFR